MPRPSKDPEDQVIRISAAFDPDAFAKLEEIMDEDGETKRSRTLVKLVNAEHARRARRAKPVGKPRTVSRKRV